MNNPSSSGAPLRTRITPIEWDALRTDFHRSMMVGTSLTGLAENIDGCVWSLSGDEETPKTYIDLTYPAVIERLRARGMPPAVMDDLVDILRGTLAFDESFGDMVHVAKGSETESDPVPRNLKRLGIPAEFPVPLCAFTAGTLDFCQREGIKTLVDFLAFSRDASRQIVIGGEFRELLNAVTHIDERAIANVLPFRLKSTGLHLVEAIGLVVRSQPEELQVRLAHDPSTLPAPAQAKVSALAAYFSADLEAIKTAKKAGSPFARIVAPLDNVIIEAAAAAVLRNHLEPPPPPAAVKPKRSFLRWLLG